jgi:Protein of unknwon function (DUF3310)
MSLGEHDPVNHPRHYTQHPSGIECIELIEDSGLLVGNAIKYLWRYNLKNGLEDLQKSRWYVERELDRREQDPRPIWVYTEHSMRAYEKWYEAEPDGPVRDAIWCLKMSETLDDARVMLRKALKYISDLVFEEVKKRA